MAKVSKEESKKTRQRIMDSAIKIIMLEGFESLTFSRISEGAGLSRSGVNCHFKLKSDLVSEIKPKLVSSIENYLEFDTVETFFNSWKNAFDNDRIFRHLVLCVGYDSGLRYVFDKITGDDRDIEETTYLSIGYMMYNRHNIRHQGGVNA